MMNQTALFYSTVIDSYGVEFEEKKIGKAKVQHARVNKSNFPVDFFGVLE